MRNVPVIAVIVSLSLTGCSAFKSNQGTDGVRLFGGGPTSPSDMQKIKEQLTQNAESSATKSVAEQALTGETRPGILIIGNVGSLRKLEGDNRTKFYKESYSATAEKWHPAQPAVMSEAEFTHQIGGYTAIVMWSIPGLIAGRRMAAVREIDQSKIDFPSITTASVFGSTGDLVVASTNDDGVILVDRLLCKDAAADYSKCAEKYVRGEFDKNTGGEIGSRMVEKSGGARIDVNTFQKISK